MPSVKYYPASFYLDISLKDSLYNNKLQVATSIIIKILVPVFRCGARVEAFAVINLVARHMRDHSNDYKVSHINIQSLCLVNTFYHTPFVGCVGIILTHGI